MDIGGGDLAHYRMFGELYLGEGHSEDYFAKIHYQQQFKRDITMCA